MVFRASAKNLDLLILSVIVIVAVVYTTGSFNSVVTYLDAKCVPFSVEKQTDEKETLVVADAKRPAKLILQWAKFFAHDTYDGITSLDPLGCEISDCLITTNHSLMNQSDAILFHAFDTKLNDLPATRNDSQRYVFSFFEPPGLMDYLEIFESTPHFFNWTMTYRRDADIYNPYGQVIRRSDLADEGTSLMQTIRGKKKLVAWFVSRCSTSSRREDYVKNLTQYVPVDVYGTCSNLSCPRSDEISCDLMLRTDYKFYLAFENSNCRDYVTEKFFRSLQYDVVPIVYGGADYKKVAPPHSHIDIKDFNSAKDLAEYLKLLDSNDKLYQAYFNWKKEYYIDTSLKQGWCHLCAKLHDPSIPRKSHENISKWYTDLSQCSKPFTQVS